MTGLTYLSSYQLMWMMVLFDLPVQTPKEKKAYVDFRNFLLDMSFSMAQYSVYVRHTSGRDQIAPIVRKIEAAVPDEGRVDILQFTDRQYADIVSLRGRRGKQTPQNPSQLALF
ncbi:CRISPR-associated endonuclease Cas2 [Ponticaulis sp.]|uniref:CRISPR-associated endonuclease Cas2 n=1 Tax=Ponticaulis sp. TaxID=2020902 RepID=UPI0025E1BB53|nr:CRISPR-associated endonuclease Cas2 [Ponticaulis sp.]